MHFDDSEEKPTAADRKTASQVSKETSASIRYCIITVVRDEEQFIASTIDSALAQTVRPLEWIIVDDGSKDRTAAIMASRAQEIPWIRLIRREDRGHRSKGGGVEGFLEAYSQLGPRTWEFLVNLDGDITFGPDYFEKCFDQFRKMPSLGIGGGTVCVKIGGHWQAEPAPAFHVRGAAKIYRRECWDALGGLWPGLGWDTIDEVKANQLGWKTQTFPGIQLLHHRLSGKMWGAWGFAVLDGEADYTVRYLPLFFCLKCVRHIFHSPILVRSIGMVYGYLRGFVRRTPRVEDRGMVEYLHRQQLRRLFGMSSIWR